MIENVAVVTADEIFEKTVDVTVKSTVIISDTLKLSTDGVKSGRVTKQSGINKMDNLYLDYTRCTDFTDDCPTSCFRARITKDVDKVPDYVLLSWAHFGMMDACPKKWANSIPVNDGLANIINYTKDEENGR